MSHLIIKYLTSIGITIKPTYCWAMKFKNHIEFKPQKLTLTLT